MPQAIGLAEQVRPEKAPWKNYVAWVSAILVAALFLLAGLWKMTDPIEAAARLAQAKVPGFLSEFAAVSFGIAETFCAILILTPRYRKSGAWLSSWPTWSALVVVCRAAVLAAHVRRCRVRVVWFWMRWLARSIS